MADMKVLHDDAISKANEVVKAMNDRVPQTKIRELKKAAKSAVDKYNGAITKEYYKGLAEKHGKDAVRVALEADGTLIPGVIGISFKETKEGVAYMSEGPAKIKINLVEMASKDNIGMDYFHSPEWFFRLQILARMMALALNNDLGGSPAFKYIVDDACEAFQLGEDADTTSKKSMTKAFQKVIDDILFVGDSKDKAGNPVNDLKFTTKNWAYIRECMTRQGAEIGNVVIGSPMKAAELVADCIHLLLKNRGNTLTCAE